MMEAHGTGAARPGAGARRRLRPVLAVSLVSAAAMLSACEGDNLFTGEGPSFVPRVTALGAPEVALGGDTIRVRVDAVAQRGISRVDISLRGAVTQDTSIRIDPPEIRVSQVVALPLPTLLSDTLIFVTASITDQFGNVSRLQERTIVAFGPPVLTTASGPSSARPGSPVLLNLAATASRPITAFDVSLRGAINKDTTVSVQPPDRQATANLVLTVPSPAADSVLNVTVTARDENGLSSVPRVLAIPLIFDPPTLDLILPASVNAGSTLLIRADAQGVRNITELRFQLSGGVNQTITRAIDPSRTQFSEFVAVDVPGDITDSQITVSAFAVDVGGTVSMTKTGTVQVPTGNPSIVSVTAPASVIGGEVADVRVRAQGVRPITQIDVQFRGAVNLDQSVTISQSRYDVEADFSAVVPESAPDGVLTVRAWATDASGAKSPIFTTTITVIAKDTTSASAPLPDAPPVAGAFTAAGGPAGLGPAAAAVRIDEPALLMAYGSRRRTRRRR